MRHKSYHMINGLKSQVLFRWSESGITGENTQAGKAYRKDRECCLEGTTKKLFEIYSRSREYRQELEILKSENTTQRGVI